MAGEEAGDFGVLGARGRTTDLHPWPRTRSMFYLGNRISSPDHEQEGKVL